MSQPVFRPITALATTTNSYYHSSSVSTCTQHTQVLEGRYILDGRGFSFDHTMVKHTGGGRCYSYPPYRPIAAFGAWFVVPCMKLQDNKRGAMRNPKSTVVSSVSWFVRRQTSFSVLTILFRIWQLETRLHGAGCGRLWYYPRCWNGSQKSRE